MDHLRLTHGDFHSGRISLLSVKPRLEIFVECQFGFGNQVGLCQQSKRAQRECMALLSLKIGIKITYCNNFCNDYVIFEQDTTIKPSFVTHSLCQYTTLLNSSYRRDISSEYYFSRKIFVFFQRWDSIKLSTILETVRLLKHATSPWYLGGGNFVWIDLTRSGNFFLSANISCWNSYDSVSIFIQAQLRETWFFGCWFFFWGFSYAGYVFFTIFYTQSLDISYDFEIIRLLSTLLSLEYIKVLLYWCKVVTPEGFQFIILFSTNNYRHNSIILNDIFTTFVVFKCVICL